MFRSYKHHSSRKRICRNHSCCRKSRVRRTFVLKIFTVKNLANTLELLKENGYWIVSTSDRGTEDWSKLPDLNELVILMGNEGEGIKRILMEKSDFVLRIPMYGNLSSLNVTVATGIVLDRIVNRKFG